MKRLLFVCGITAGSLSFLASAANASIIYSYTTDLPQAYVGAPGSTVQFNVFLVETVTGTDGSLIVGDDGLNGAGASIVRGAGGTATLTSQTLNFADFTGGTALSTKHLTAGALDFTENVSLAASDGTKGTTVGLPSGVTRQLLDTVVITLPSAPGSTTSFVLGRNQAGFGSTVSYVSTFNLDADGSTQDLQYGGPGGTAADGTIYSWKGAGDTTSTFTVSTTPEPASVGFMGIAGLLALRRRRKA